MLHLERPEPLSDDDIEEAEMMGVPDSTIEAWEDSAAEDAEEVCWMLEENVPVLDVFLRAPYELLAGATGGHYQPPHPDRILAVCRLLRQPRKLWPAILDGVLTMAAIVVPRLNDEAHKRSG